MATRALGKGLAALISEAAQEGSSLKEVDLTAIEPNPWQPRTQFNAEALAELAASVREHGILQPLLVTPKPEGGYLLVAGERRFRAAQAAGLIRVPVAVKSCTPQEMLEIALVENVQREDIGPIEAARAYLRLADEFGLTQEQIAGRVGKSRVAVTNTIRLLSLPIEVQDGVEGRTISEGHARALLGASGDAAQTRIFRQVVRRGLSVRETEQLARAAGSPAAVAPRSRPAPSPEIKFMNEQLSSQLYTRVRILPAGQGGRIEIDYFDQRELERLFDILSRAG
ncbi:MAG: ParB/RepB/Spo0J family partition protein [Armatimonadetes bacterium]|nr:ParB/RepB/Spo0J family partition protein [Armatimonadota bacterium]MDE2206101.1 ParB/RepB/Spo0J family partition protein [Armatimonadota bacterium]